MASSAGYTTLRVDPNQYLGLKYNRFRNGMYKFALTNQEEYYTLRESILDHFVSKSIDNLFDLIYFALMNGTTPDGSAIGNGFPIGSDGKPIEPQLPAQKVNDICVSACATLHEIIDKEVIEILMPADYNALMQSRLADRGQARLMGDL